MRHFGGPLSLECTRKQSKCSLPSRSRIKVHDGTCQKIWQYFVSNFTKRNRIFLNDNKLRNKIYRNENRNFKNFPFDMTKMKLKKNASSTFSFPLFVSYLFYFFQFNLFLAEWVILCDIPDRFWRELNLKKFTIFRKIRHIKSPPKCSTLIIRQQNKSSP